MITSVSNVKLLSSAKPSQQRERQCQMYKIWWFGWLWVTQGHWQRNQLIEHLHIILSAAHSAYYAPLCYTCCKFWSVYLCVGHYAILRYINVLNNNNNNNTDVLCKNRWTSWVAIWWGRLEWALPKKLCIKWWSTVNKSVNMSLIYDSTSISSGSLVYGICLIHCVSKKWHWRCTL